MKEFLRWCLLLTCAALSSSLLQAHEPYPASATDIWSKVTDGPLELYTVDDSSAGADLLRSFARMRVYFAQAAPFSFSDQSHLAIIAFHSEKDFAQYRLNAGSCAFYQQTSRGEYVVLQDLSADHREVSTHEFTHFVIAHSGLKLPLWMNEGMADFYSTVSFADDEAVTGKPVPGRLALLRRQTWVPLNALFEVGVHSDYYSDPAKMAVFYSESWALTHMLTLSPAYAPRWADFLHSISQGHSAGDSLQSIYGKTVAEVEADLHMYVGQPRLPVSRAKILFPPASGPESRSSSVSATEIDLALSALSLSNPDSKTGIQTRLASVADRFPENARAEEALGFMAMRQGNSSEARVHFRKAVERHSVDPSVYFYLGHFDEEAGVAGEQVMPLLRQALELKPDYYEAHLEVAMIATSAHDYALALESLRKVGSPHPEHAYNVAYALAYCYAQTDKLTDARKYAAQARLLAANTGDQAEITNLVSFIDQQQADRGETPLPR